MTLTIARIRFQALSQALSCGALAVGLTGCTVAPPYVAPTPPVPPAFAQAQGQGAVVDPAHWWSRFGDPVLDGLITRALADNLDIAQAGARVEQARAQERATRASHGPTVNASAQASYNRLSANSLPSALGNLISGGGSGGGSGGASGFGLAGESYSTFQTGFDASWELDLFGRQRSASEAAQARTQAAQWSQADAQVVLVAEVARTYQRYRAFQRRLIVQDALLAAQSERLDLMKVRAGQGLTDTTALRGQERTLAQSRAQRADLAAQGQVALHALGTLLGQGPDALQADLAAPPAGDPAALSTVPAGLPSELLLRRPDLRAAERKLAAATADIGVAKADLYPRFSLTGALQLASRSLTTLVEGDSILASGAGKLSLPVLGRATTKATIQLRQAQADEARLAYLGSVQGALRDVEDALVRLDADRARAADLGAAQAAAQDAEQNARTRARTGLSSAAEALSAQETALAARDAWLQAEADAAQDMVALYKALGGGWDERRLMTGANGEKERAE